MIEITKDTMTPKERQQALAQGQAIDRLPIMLFHGTVGARIAGMTYKESEASAENIAKKEVMSYRRFGFDNMSVNFGLYGLGRAMGNEFKEVEDATASISKYVMDQLDDMDRLDSDKVLLENDPAQQKLYRAIELIQAEVGAEIRVDYEITGPMTSIASLMEPEQILRATRKQPDKVHQLLRFATDCLLKIIDQFHSLGDIGFSITDPVASGALMSPKQYLEFSLPYTKELVDRMHQYESQVTMHICGDTTKSLPYIASTGLDFFSVDQVVDLAAAKASVGDQLGLIGNVNPVAEFLQGTPESITEAVRQCFEAAWDNPAGFYIGPGCSVPYMTSEANIQAYMDAARYYGQYPLTPERFGK